MECRLSRSCARREGTASCRYSPHLLRPTFQFPTQGDSMSVTSKQTIALAGATAVLAALAGCQKAPEQKAEAAAAPAFKLDETQLLQPIRFTAADIDASKSACTDLGAYANDKWLAVNPIPA